ncbi:biotin--[acetyl-CoA-carboxylase] ligase [Actinoplanes sp. ATCC 53533]|uniref:biotin--[acetyl-CoA-carboxylase] ligase n=1 Tax=Actinoplanes sp. ATCC 53533 TaxID=1288362 RepID=UPI000F76F11B|nr:biotin--[acetyl-CoA-carboxylase] ligase [Actinoplanes sp. ATCC 53533]RSM56483.1 biotin--[acetyl-CoA-carboxylase] ligase [Actinoplanes sp. ATCC 53533]
MASSPYTDLDRPPLGERSLQRALIVPGGFWQRLEIWAETGSTNADAAAAAAAGAAEGLVVVAERQVAGRGRRDRQWVSPPRAGLTLSFLLRPGAADAERGWAPAPQRTWGWLPLLAGVALLEAVQRLAEVDAGLKWPNDLLLTTAAGEAKTAGILAEASGDAVVVGIGLNVTTRGDELPATTGLPATSLQVAGAKSTDRDPLLRALLRGVARWYAGWREAGGDAEMCGLLAAYQRDCATIGRDVRVLLPNDQEFTGTATTVDSDGQLVVRTADGERRVSAGDVLHVR